MAKQIKSVHKKRRGRPAGRRYAETIPVRLSPLVMGRIDAYSEAEGLSRSEAVRRLVEIGLDSPDRKR